MAGIAPGMMMGATLCLPGGGRPVALIYPASKKQHAGNLALFCLRYLGAVSSSHIIGGFRSGLFTPTEAGAVAASMRCLSPQLFTVK